MRGYFLIHRVLRSVYLESIVKKKKSNQAITPIIGILLLMVIVVGVFVGVLAYVSNSLGTSGSSLFNDVQDSGNQAAEQLSVEQTAFNLTSSGSPTSYVIVTFSNTQTSATSSPFQQMLTINPSFYSSLESTDLGNVRFYQTLSGGIFRGPIDSWLESVSSTPANTATSATFWLNLLNGIPASSQLSVYMDFSATTEFDGITAGEAPQLSSTYAQYDNGANIFLYYNNGGSTTNLNVANGGTLSVTTQTNPYGLPASVLTLTGPGTTSTSAETVAWFNSGLIGDNFLAEGWININTNLNGLFAVRGGSSSGLTNYLIGDGWTGEAASIVYQTGTTNTFLSGSGTRAAGWFWDVATVVGTNLNASIYSAPPYLGGTLASTTIVSNSNLGALNQYVGVATWAGSTSAAYFYGWRIRDNPPGGVMPSYTFGSTLINTPPQAGVVLYIRNTGANPVSIGGVYVLDEATGALVMSLTPNSPILVDSGSIQQVSITFTPTNGIAYKFVIATLSGSRFTYTTVA
jgi:hypothetical protein